MSALDAVYGRSRTLSVAHAAYNPFSVTLCFGNVKTTKNINMKGLNLTTVARDGSTNGARPRSLGLQSSPAARLKEETGGHINLRKGE